MTKLEENLQAIKNEKDSKIVPENIKAGVTIFDVTGNLEPDKPDQTKTVTPSAETQTVRADTGYELASVTVNPIPLNIYCQGPDGDGTWSEKETVIPYNGYQNDGALIGTDVYLFGGSRTTADYTKAYKYDTLTNTWTQLTDIPYNFYNGSVTAVGTDCYLFGGSVSQTVAYKYDTLTDTYTQLMDIPISGFIASGRAVAINTTIYLMMGSNTTNKAYKYDTTTDTYTQLTDIPSSFSSQGRIATVDTDIYLFAGGTGNLFLYKYNTITDTYTQLSSHSFPMVDSSVGVIGTDIYLLGSYNTTNAYKYDTLTDTYAQLTSMKYNYSNGVAIALDNAIYVFGGASYPTKVQVFTLNTGEPEQKQRFMVEERFNT